MGIGIPEGITHRYFLMTMHQETEGMQYIVFTDESYITAERYRSIGAFSLPKEHYRKLDSKLREMLNDLGINEFKWSELRTEKYTCCAERILDYTLGVLFSKEIRIDVLTWDTWDSRHSIQGRDDTANFERMFFHLLKFVITKREKESSWFIYPDERLEINWRIIKECLNNVGKWIQLYNYPLFGDIFSKENFKIKEFQPIKSIEFPCCHISDFFAGLSVFSINNYSKYKHWVLINDLQFDMFGVQKNYHFSSSENYRFKILNKLIRLCKHQRLGVSFDTNGRLATPDPANPINFWYYKPQRENDKAPIKEK